MDISKLSHGAKLVLGATIGFLIFSFFNWQEVEVAGIVAAGASMWHGWGVLAGLIAIAIIVWEGLRLANMKVEIGLTPAMVTTALSILLLLATILKFLVDNEFRTFWAWLGLILAICIVVGAFANMRMAGESITDMKTSMAAAAGSASRAVKQATSSATDKPDDGRGSASAEHEETPAEPIEAADEEPTGEDEPRPAS